MGNVLEWYDFALFGFFSDVIAEVFFAPSGQEVKDDDLGYGGEIGVDGADTGNLIKSFLVYGIGELCYLSGVVSTIHICITLLFLLFLIIHQQHSYQDH